MFQKDYFQTLVRQLADYPQNPGLVAISKYVAIADIAEAYAAGLRNFGESRAHDLQAKAQHFAKLADPIRWHFIGHLQTNKINKVLPLVSVIHSIDSLDLTRAIVEYISKHPPPSAIDVYLQINLSGSEQKYGFALDGLAGIVECISLIRPCQHLHLIGLMGMSSAGASSGKVGSEFSTLRQLRDQLDQTHGPLRGLSMGMSGDFEIALSEGSTVIRLGSHLFSKAC